MKLARCARPFSWLCLTLLLGAAGCDSPIDPGDPQTVNVNGNAAALFGFTNHTVTATRRGVATATLSFAAGDLDIFVTSTACLTGPVADVTSVCNARVSAIADAGTSEVVRFGVIESEAVKIWVQNFSGAAGRAYTIEVVVRGE